MIGLTLFLVLASCTRHDAPFRPRAEATPPSTRGRPASCPFDEPGPQPTGDVALLVGINDYGGSPDGTSARWTPLLGTHNDVRVMADALNERAFDVVILLDEAATRACIERGFQRHLARAGEGDTALFFFSGHGQQIPDQVDQPDEADGYDEALVPWDHRGQCDGNGHLRDDRIGELVRELTEAHAEVVLIIDACHSESLSRAGGLSRGGKPCLEPSPGRRDAAKVGFGLAQPKPGARGYTLLTASRADEAAVERRIGSVGDAKHFGVFTYFLAQALREADKRTTWRQLVDQLRRRLRQEGYSQEPQIEGDGRKLVFSNGWGTASGRVPAHVIGQTIVIDGGFLHLFAVGDEVELFRAGSTRLEGIAMVTAVGPTSASASLRNGLRPSLRGDFLEVQGRDPDVTRVEHVGDEVRIRRADGGFVPIPVPCEHRTTEGVSSDARDVATKLKRAAEIDRSRMRIEALANPAPDQRLDVALDVHPVRGRYDERRHRWIVTRDDGPLASLDPDRRIGLRQLIQLHVSNRSSVGVYVAIVELRVGGGIQLLYPFETLGRDESFVRAKKTVQLPLVRTDDGEGPVTWKLIATESFVDFQSLVRRITCPGPQDRGGEVATTYRENQVSNWTRWGTAVYRAKLSKAALF